MKRILLLSYLLLAVSPSSFGQHLGMTFQEARLQNISIPHLDSLYTSAVHTDASKAVFKTEKEQQNLQQAYIKLLQDFGKFLSAHDFKWERKTKCYNRIYFSADGTIDYFLFNFLGKPEEKPSDNQQETFKQLLQLFIRDYQFALTAPTKFAQCSPTTYSP